MKRLFYLTAIVGITLASCTKPGNGTKVEKTYPVSVSAQQTSNNTDETRVENIEGIDHWSVGDKIGLFVFNGGTMEALSIPVGDLHVDYTGNDWYSGFNAYAFSQSVIANLAMTGLHTEPSPTTDFQSTLTYEQISSLDPNSLYDYFAYYPYLNADLVHITTSLMFPDREITVQSNVFPAHTVRLFGTVHINSSPITWFDENDEQQWGERKVFNHGHTISYLRLRLAGNIVNPDVPVVCINITTGVWTIEYIFDDQTGKVADIYFWTDQIINIEGGMNVGDYIYIPILGSMDYSMGNTLDFEFTFADGTKYTKSISGSMAEMGKIHPISFNLQ